MRDLPPGWETDIAVLRHTGSLVEENPDHLLVRSPHNPLFHWGNCLFVTDGDLVDDADRWVRTFEAAFPDATWVAIGLVRMPDDRTAWTSLGIEVELDDVLSTVVLPRQTTPPEGYTFRAIEGGDWTSYRERAVAENASSGEHDPESYEQFADAQARSRRDLCERGVAAFFGAFAGDALVADLGIVRCGTTARYQSVGTDQGHRRRGLATHLLGLAARWAADRGCDRWVIITEVTNPAGRVYRSLGFEPDIGNAQAYRSSHVG